MRAPLPLELDSLLTRLEVALPLAEPLAPALEPFLDSRRFLFAVGDLLLASGQLLLGLLCENGRVIIGEIAEGPDQLPVDQCQDGGPIEIPAESQCRFLVDYLEAATGTRTIRYVSSCPRPASSLRSSLATVPRSSTPEPSLPRPPRAPNGRGNLAASDCRRGESPP